MPHIRISRRKPKASVPLIPLAAILVAATLGLAACGGSSGSSSNSAKTAANAAAVGRTAPASTPSGTSSTGTTPSGTVTGTTPSGTATGTTPAARSGSPSLTAIRTCLAKKGITLPQSHPLAGAKLPKGMSRAQFYEELRGCAGGIVPPGNHSLGNSAKSFHNPFNNPRFHQVLVRFSACLRQNGINVGEPNTSGKGPIFNTKGINTGSPQFKAATAKCRATLLGALRSKARPGASAAG
jgi:hypothetical protein